jgi:hypothetical protein
MYLEVGSGETCVIATLIFTFTFSAYAGEIECPGVTASSPQTNVAGDMPTGGITETVILLMLALA